MRFSPTSDRVNTCKFSMYIYPAGILAIWHYFFFSFEMFISHLSQFVKKKLLMMIMCWANVSCFGLNFSGLSQSCFSSILCVLGFPVEYKISTGAQIVEWSILMCVPNWTVCYLHEWVSLQGQVVQCEVLTLPLLQVSQSPEKVIAWQEEKISSLELKSSHKILVLLQ